MNDLERLIRDVPDFPEPGIVFKDITPLLGDAAGLQAALASMANGSHGDGITKVAGIESRGFILAPSVADRIGAGFVPIRKPGKLPWKTVRREYELEYGTDAMEMHADAVTSADRVLVVDDVLATGGTAAAAVDLVRSVGATVVGVVVLLELTFLAGRERLDVPVRAVITVDG
jgi:adenine phosphoribosyltransferase